MDCIKLQKCDIFRWVTVNGEGVPPEKIYQDDRVRLKEDGDEELDATNDANSVSHVSTKQQNGLKDWLGEVVEHPPTGG
jgi:hypothetical protein